MNSVGPLVDEFRRNPNRFRATDGYERLLDALREGQAPDALKQLLREGSDVAGDLLWTIAELEAVEPFVFEARQYLSSQDKGTAAYAMEIVLRGAQESGDLRAALDELRVCDVAICEHAVRTLAGEGLTRLKDILQNSGYTWSGALANKLLGPVSRKVIEGLILDGSRERQVIGVALATLAWERDPNWGEVFARSAQVWIRDYGKWLAQAPGESTLD